MYQSMRNALGSVVGRIRRTSGISTTGEASEEQTRQSLVLTLSQYTLPFIFLVYFVFLAITSPVFLTPLNLFNVTRQVAVVGLLSMGQLICILTGNIDLSVGTFLGLWGALLGGLSLKFGFPIAMALCILVVLFWGLMNGFLVTRGTGISVIVTLSTMYMARGITLIYTDGRPIINFPIPYDFFGVGNLGPVPWSLIIFACVGIIVFVILRMTPLGRHIYAVGGNKQAAKVSGLNLTWITIGAYIATAALSALGAMILLGRIASAQPDAGVGMELDSIATVMIGGASMAGGYGGVVTTAIGIFMLGLINNGLNLLGVNSYWQYICKGVIIVIAVMVDTLRHRNRA